MTNSISKLSKSLHWIIAVMMIALFIVGKISEDMEGPAKFQLLSNHGSVGMMVFIFGIVRIINRLREGFPAPIGHNPRILEIVSKFVHWVLLILPIAMPISGLMMFYSGGNPISWFGIEIFAGSGIQNKALGGIANNMHGAGATLLLIAVILHVGGALKHHFIDKDGTLKRMLGLRY